ncbi:hypothetical protein HUT18_02130 [Streptomyces sp. NA04227]|uniref:hypothetical protein n=1 Tax=Streptomyces sp. NA04227 TaxID=2742136 RepID=UPI0015922066|nr:hypothetical protein [Streptomyces sp. NA04227]QKW05350.1 hypothetical protein HUT18_02130 [Streptomyces sp. NA04227]
MWPGQEPPSGAPNPQQPQGAPNPYQQPGHQAAGVPQQYGQPVWNAPTQASTPAPPPGGGSPTGNRTTAIAVTAAAVVVVASVVAGFLYVGGDDDKAAPQPTMSESGSQQPTENPRGGKGLEPTVPGWQVISDPKRGVAFDVPSQWVAKSPSWVTWFDDEADPEGKPLIGMAAPAFHKERWCSTDNDRDGTKEDTALGAAGTRGNNGSRTPEEAATGDARKWVYGAYTQPDKKSVKVGAPESHTTSSGLKGTVVSASSDGVRKEDKCDSEGKATVFSFRNKEGDILSWAFFGAKGVGDEIPQDTVLKILDTVRLVKNPSGS